MLILGTGHEGLIIDVVCRSNGVALYYKESIWVKWFLRGVSRCMLTIPLQRRLGKAGSSYNIASARRVVEFGGQHEGPVGMEVILNKKVHVGGRDLGH